VVNGPGPARSIRSFARQASCWARSKKTVFPSRTGLEEEEPVTQGHQGSPGIGQASERNRMLEEKDTGGFAMLQRSSLLKKITDGVGSEDGERAGDEENGASCQDLPDLTQGRDNCVTNG
jgi:hypothetical protein